MEQLLLLNKNNAALFIKIITSVPGKQGDIRYVIVPCSATDYQVLQPCVHAGSDTCITCNIAPEIHRHNFFVQITMM